VDLFLNSNDTSNLIGFPGSFFYIFNGELRQNSISHRLDIPNTQSVIELNWKVNGPEQLNVHYNVEFLEKRNKFLTVNTAGYVPHKLSKFDIKFNCTYLATRFAQQTDDFFDLSLNMSFKLNNTRLLLELQLVTPPPITVSILFRKHCPLFNKTTSNSIFSKKLNKTTQNSSFAIAYIIIATLCGFLLIILFTTISMCLSSKYKVKKKLINTKYESLQQIRARAKQNLKKSITPTNMATCTNRSNEGTAMPKKVFVKNSHTNSKRISRRQLNQSRELATLHRQQKSFISTTNLDDNDDESVNSNIYESVIDDAANSTQHQQQQQQSIIRETVVQRQNAKQMLNVTTNTMQSAVFRDTYSTNTTLIGGNNLKVPNSELCQKFGQDLIKS
jgi:hypothetical protein